mmetsp:Transcript_66731/g.134514  ORF Transcript_66731/g.134514 Transcript_66731/m.134514 type:complete len:125 (+) Transcript_66731:116-490(+)
MWSSTGLVLNKAADKAVAMMIFSCHMHTAAANNDDAAAAATITIYVGGFVAAAIVLGCFILGAVLRGRGAFQLTRSAELEAGTGPQTEAGATSSFNTVSVEKATKSEEDVGYIIGLSPPVGSSF